MELNRVIDHTILKPEAAKTVVQKIIDEAKEHNFFSVYINPCWVAFTSEQLADTNIAVYTVTGFPLGANTPEVKAYETADTIKNGVNGVDVVVNTGALESQQCDHIRQDIQGVVDAAKGKTLIKVIIKTTLLTDEEKVKACELTREAGADFARTSTGFSAGGAKVANIRLIRETVGPDMGVKASGDVHNAERALAMIEVGATHTGVSTGVAIVSGTTDEGY